MWAQPSGTIQLRFNVSALSGGQQWIRFREIVGAAFNIPFTRFLLCKSWRPYDPGPVNGAVCERSPLIAVTTRRQSGLSRGDFPARAVAESGRHRRRSL